MWGRSTPTFLEDSQRCQPHHLRSPWFAVATHSHPSLPEASKIEQLLSAIKRPYSFRVKQMLTQHRSPLLKRLTIRQRPGVMTFRYWQEGPGYDRNLDNDESVMASIQYIHENPLRRGLCQNICQWKWSSARWYAELVCDPWLPRLTPLPPHFFE